MMKKWKELSRKTVCEKYGRGLESVHFALPNGREEEFYLYKQSNDVVIVCALTENNMVILVKQFRPGPQDFITELPAGCVDDGEEAIVAAARELQEETGFVGEMDHLASAYRSVYSDVKHHYFIAQNCIKISEQRLDENEDIDVILMSLKDFRAGLQRGEFVATIQGGYMALDYVDLL